MFHFSLGGIRSSSKCLCPAVVDLHTLLELFFCFSLITNMPNDDNFHLEYNLAALVAHQVTFNRLLRGESNLRPPWYTSVKKKLGIRRVKHGLLYFLWIEHSFEKISKLHFFTDIWNSFHWVTHMGLEPHQKKFFWEISKSTGASLSQSLDTKRGVADISIVLWPKFFHQFTTGVWLTTGENFIRVS